MEFLDGFLDIIYPKHLQCMICKSPIQKNGEPCLCNTCAKELEKLDNQCSKCGRALIFGQKCTACEDEKYAFDGIHSLFWYNDPIHRLIYRYKYGEKPYLAEEMAKFLYGGIEERGLIFEYLSYVPISDQRKKQRGFDQGELLSRELGKLRGIPSRPLIERIKNTSPLAKLPQNLRTAMVENAFRIRDLSWISSGARILLVDDIFTTGATLNEIAKTVKKERKDLKIIGLTFCTARR